MDNAFKIICESGLDAKILPRPWWHKMGLFWAVLMIISGIYNLFLTTPILYALLLVIGGVGLILLILIYRTYKLHRTIKDLNDEELTNMVSMGLQLIYKGERWEEKR